jgi:hypothetical protein
MAAKKDIKKVDKLFQDFLAKAMPYLTGENKKEVLDHLNEEFRHVSKGKAKKLVKRAEKEFGVSLADQFKAIERAERGSWGRRVSK